MASKSAELRLTLLDGVTGPARRIQGSLASLNRQTSSAMAPLRGIGGQLLAFGAGYIGVSKGISSTVGAAMDFESAFADVRKVVDASDAQFEVMGRSIRKMSTELPMASTEIAALFAAAGESGIATNELKSFAEMASRVGIAFDMSASDAGESLAKLKTQFGLSVAETGDLADAVNHLSNNMASKSSEITTFLLKVGSLSEMAGFAKEEVAALGSAMIAAGAQPEVAATAMQNVAKKMTAGSLAKKEQRDVAKMLGLDLPTLSKEMQKDAPGAVKKVLKAISKQSKDKHISLLSGFFGDEAKAFAPLIANTELMDKALDSVADKSKYTGSAFREFTARADTTANALQILRNKIGYVFEDIGLSWLPALKEGIADFGHVMDTLDSRFTIFDEFKSRFSGLLSGLGMGDGTDALKGIRDLIFGAEDASGAADKYGRLFGQFQEYGKSIREFGKEVKDNPIVKFLSDLSPLYVDALKWSVGFFLLAGAIRKFAAAMMLISGASMMIGMLKGLGGLLVDMADFPGLNDGKSPKKTPKGGTDLPNVLPWWSQAATWFKGLGVNAAIGAIPQILSDTPGDTHEDKVRNQAKAQQALRRLFGMDPDKNYWSEFFTVPDDDGGRAVSMDAYLDDFAPKQEQYEGGRHRAGAGVGPQPFDGAVYRLGGATVSTGAAPITDASRMLKALGAMPSGYQQDRPVTLDSGTIVQLLQPTRGVQEVRVTNKQVPEIRQTNNFYITEATSGRDTAAAVMSDIGGAVKNAVEAADTD